jgi:hypothetical protein
MSRILELLSDIPTNAVLRERLALIREQAEIQERKLGEARNENAKLKERVATLEKTLSAQTAREEFVEHRGALFKRKAEGGYHRAVFCPKCHGPMASPMRSAPYFCQCGTFVDFTGRQLESVMRELPQ